MMMLYKELYKGLEDMSAKGGSDIGIIAAKSLVDYAKEQNRYI